MISNPNEILYKNETIICKDIVLRKYRESDIPALYDFYSDPETLRYLDWPKDEYTLQDAHEAIYNHFWSSPGKWAISLTPESDTIGSIDLGLDRTHDRASFGYVLSRSHWGKGYMPQALGAIMKLAFEEIRVNKMESMCYVGNEKSGRVMEKCGMVHEGTKKEHRLIRGQYMDTMMYGITSKMYYASK